ncbi:MAG TPA: hypothetical protein VFO97_00630, partial [Desertimonas sp.]|nr:hypothetical protein [Desertimonas sp.]
MGFNNPDWTWSELEAALSDRGGATDPWERGDPRARHRGLGGAQERQGLGGAQEKRRDGRAPGSPSWNAGGDGPAWSRKRQPFEASGPSGGGPGSGSVPYAELHCHSNFSFLDGASHPEELVTEAAR